MSFGIKSATTQERRDVILHGNTFKTLTTLALPSLLLATVQALIPLIDGIFVNNVIGGYAAGAISYCGPAINLINAIGLGMGTASTAIIGQINGMGDYSKVRKVATQVMVLSTILSVILVPIILLIAKPLTANISEDLSADAFIYLITSSFMLPLTFLTAQFNAYKNASGRPEMPLFISLFLLIAKVSFDFLFIYTLQLKVFGAALASVSAYIVVILIVMKILFLDKGEERLTLKGFSLDKAIIHEIFRIGFPSMLQGAVLQVGFILMNFEVVKFGPAAMTGMSVASNVNNFAFSVPAALATAVTTMVSMNMGAANPKKAKKSCWDAMLLGVAVSIILCICIIPFRTDITTLFTRDPEISQIANWATLLMTFSGFGYSACMIIMAAFTGLGNTKIPFIVNVLRVWGFRYLFILFTARWLQLDSVIIGNLFSNYAAAVVSFILFLRITWVSHLSIHNFDLQNTNPEKPIKPDVS